MPKPRATLMPDDLRRGLLDTNILILRHAIDPDELPDEVAVRGPSHWLNSPPAST